MYGFFFACRYVHCMCVWYPWRSEEGVDPLEIESQMAVNYHVGAGNGTWVLGRVDRALNG